MSSNSIRVAAELFASAQQEGTLMSRSAAQQIEHWARLGAALEATGLSVADGARLLRTKDSPRRAHEASEEDLWVFKRERQLRDIENVRAGRVSGARMSWFAGGRARAAKVVNAPY